MPEVCKELARKSCTPVDKPRDRRKARKLMLHACMHQRTAPRTNERKQSMRLQNKGSYVKMLCCRGVELLDLILRHVSKQSTTNFSVRLYLFVCLYLYLSLTLQHIASSYIRKLVLDGAARLACDAISIQLRHKLLPEGVDHAVHALQVCTDPRAVACKQLLLHVDACNHCAADVRHHAAHMMSEPREGKTGLHVHCRPWVHVCAVKLRQVWGKREDVCRVVAQAANSVLQQSQDCTCVR